MEKAKPDSRTPHHDGPSSGPNTRVSDAHRIAARTPARSAR
ncbi:hypothetical protein DM39_6955 [Burkholderia cenocepacia]|uniref:Uncharacterized protein n=1 Tax=Burkholderia cenocepacia TaxID=95486 RepID=A0AAN0VKJ5_9BURK|nr:hypothetical protein DM39_6955 [Burkholderia cenocepacia]